MSQKASMEDREVFDEMLTDIRASIYTKRKRLAHVKAKLEKQRDKENRLKQEAAKKEKELDENHRVADELKQKHSVICSTLEAKRIIFDCQLRQMHQSSESREKECKVSSSYDNHVLFQERLQFSWQPFS